MFPPPFPFFLSLYIKRAGYKVSLGLEDLEYPLR